MDLLGDFSIFSTWRSAARELRTDGKAGSRWRHGGEKFMNIDKRETVVRGHTKLLTKRLRSFLVEHIVDQAVGERVLLTRDVSMSNARVPH